MSCHTAYFLRDRDGSCWTVTEKWGTWDLVGESDRDALIEWIRLAGVPGNDGSVREALDTGYFCRGVAFDLVTRRHRFYGCGLWSRGADYHEVFAKRRAMARGWADWDVGYAWGGHEDFVDMPPGLGPVEPAATSADGNAPSPAAARLTSREGWFVDWDPARLQISVLYHETSAEWFALTDAMVSIIGTDRVVRDFQLHVDDAIPWLAEHGEPLTTELLAHDPYPLPEEGVAGSGAVIDLLSRRLQYWTAEAVTSQLRAKLAAAWPGWRIERLPLGFIGHLAGTGRSDAEVISTDAELRNSGWDDELIGIRNAERRALPAETRKLRSPSVRVVEDA
ncbi:hypothetical protein YWIDRAFT_00404 [Streptomyces sp. SceaMP-e96]|uniref:hypothetical protein n=1 Tax=Streptomyces TaxID=1883 RepID=UPI000823D8D4|nr:MULTISPECIES: hypothetical protein [unclassified Streptomyces]SCK07662.1 hypothetical protein YWIDRAFT_00404 [Streptomyces sp. SceaMP-e96]